jgi:hypothetical protein
MKEKEEKKTNEKEIITHRVSTSKLAWLDNKISERPASAEEDICTGEGTPAPVSRMCALEAGTCIVGSDHLITTSENST